MKAPNESATSKFSSRPRTSAFEKDLDSYYLLMDVNGHFKNHKISCVLHLRDIIPAKLDPEYIKRDLLDQLGKIGKVVRTVHKNQSVFI